MAGDVKNFNFQDPQIATCAAYLSLLESRIIENEKYVYKLEKENYDLKQEIEAINHNHDLTVKWIKGEFGN